MSFAPYPHDKFDFDLDQSDPLIILTDQSRKQCRILFTWVKNVSVFKVDFFGGGWWTCYVHYQQFIASPDLLAIHDNSGMWHFLQQFPKNNNLLNVKGPHKVMKQM